LVGQYIPLQYFPRFTDGREVSVENKVLGKGGVDTTKTGFQFLAKGGRGTELFGELGDTQGQGFESTDVGDYQMERVVVWKEGIRFAPRWISRGYAFERSR
jgi:hypothetical protein